MSDKKVFVIVDGDRVRYNRVLHHNTLLFDLRDPKQFDQAQELAFGILHQLKSYIRLYGQLEPEEVEFQPEPDQGEE